MIKKVMSMILTVVLIVGMLPANIIFAADNVTYHNNIEDAAAELRKGMVNREETVRVGYTSRNMQEEITEEFVQNLFDKAVSHTGNLKKGIIFTGSSIITVHPWIMKQVCQVYSLFFI